MKGGCDAPTNSATWARLVGTFFAMKSIKTFVLGAAFLKEGCISEKKEVRKKVLTNSALSARLVGTDVLTNSATWARLVGTMPGQKKEVNAPGKHTEGG